MALARFRLRTVSLSEPLYLSYPEALLTAPKRSTDALTTPSNACVSTATVDHMAHAAILPPRWSGSSNRIPSCVQYILSPSSKIPRPQDVGGYTAAMDILPGDWTSTTEKHRAPPKIRQCRSCRSRSSILYHRVGVEHHLRPSQGGDAQKRSGRI